MKQRIVVALIAVPPILAAIWWGGIWWVFLVSVVAVLGGAEFYGLMRLGGYRPTRWLGISWLLLLVLSFWQSFPLSFSLVLSSGFIATLIHALYQTEKPILNWAITAVGALYLGTILGHALELRLLQNGLWWVLMALMVTWTNDVFAYFIGVSVGFHKIWPRLSPKKSWEGTIGGWIFATATGASIAAFTPIVAAPWMGAVIGLGGGILAFFGDLSISLLKRQVGAKDSGILVPGHGGVLDRLDSLLFVFPFVYQLALLVIA